MTQSFKKVVSLMLAVLMVFSVCVTAMAEEATETPKELTALDLGVTDGNDTKLYDDPTGTGDKVFKAIANNNRPNVELADKATGKAFDTVADQYYTVKFDYYFESLTEGANFSFDLYYGAFSKYDPTVLGSGKQMISSTNSGFSKNFVGDGQWHTMTLTFKAFDAVNTYKDGTEIVKETVTEEVPVYEEDGVTPKLNEDGTPVVETVTKEVEVEKDIIKERALPYLYLTWYTSKTLKAYIKNIEIIDEGVLDVNVAYDNYTISMGNILNTKGELVKDAGMTSAYDGGNNKVTLNEDNTVSLTLDSMTKGANVGKAEWAHCITPVTLKGKSNPFCMDAKTTYTVSLRYKVDVKNSDIGLCLAYADGVSTGATMTTAVVKKVITGTTDGWETIVATFNTSKACNLKIALTGSKGTVVTLGDITIARLAHGFTNAKIYTMNDNGQPYPVAAYVGTDITVKGNNSDNVALGEKFMGWYEDANYVTKAVKYGEVTDIYAKYPTTIIDFNHMPHPRHPNGINTNQGQSHAYDKGIWRIISSANIGGMIPAYDAAGVPDTVHYALKQGVKYEITYYYQAKMIVKEEYTEEVTVTKPKVDENGDVIYKFDDEGNPIQAKDAEGNLLFEDGEPVWEVETEEVTETVTKTKDVDTLVGAGPKLNHTLASSAAVAGGRDTHHEHTQAQLPDSDVYTSSTNHTEFTAYTVTLTGDITEAMNGICFRFHKSGINFRMDKITIREVSDETVAEGGVKVSATLNYNDGVTEDETVSLANGEIYELPTPTREGYIFAGWYSHYRIGNEFVTASDIPVSFIAANAASMGTTYTAQWVAEGTNRVEFSEEKYASIGSGDKGGKFSIVTDETVDTESADNAYAVMNEPGQGNIYKVSLFNDDGSRMYAMEGVTYRFTIRYKVNNDRGTDGLSIGVGRSLINAFAPTALDSAYGNMSTVVKSKNTDGFVTATEEFTVKNIYEAGTGETESGFGRLRQQLCLRINSGEVYVDYVEVTPIAYTPEYALYIDNADVDVDFENKTFTITPDEGYEIKVGSVKSVVMYEDYTITAAYTDEAGKAHKEKCTADENLVIKHADLSSADGYTYSFSIDGIKSDRLASLAFTADIVEADTTNAALIGVSTRAESGKGETYKSAGIRFRGRVSAATVENASEIGFVVVPKAALETTVADYMAKDGKLARKGVAYNAEDGINVVYKDLNNYVDYQAIVYLTTETGAYDFTEMELTVAFYVVDAEGNTSYVAEYTDSYANRAK